MPKLKSPLRYPGGKSCLVDYMEATIKEKIGPGCTIFEPYAGGASVSLALLGEKVVSRAVLVERDPLLYAFWRCVRDAPEELCERIQEVRVDLPTWHEFRQYLDPQALDKWSLLDLGLAGLFLNRTNFSGIIGAKPIGGLSQSSKYKIDCRFSKDRLIEQILEIAKYRDAMEVSFGDAVEFMRAEKARMEDGFVYVDPPYYLTGRKLYRHHYTIEQHRDLAKFLDSQTFPWIVSIDNCAEIRNLYSKQKVVPIFLSYVIKKSRRAEELLISNFQLRPPVYDLPRASPMEEQFEVRARFK